MSKKRQPLASPDARFTEHFMSSLREVSKGRRDLLETFRSFCKMAACAVSAGQREAEYLEEAKRWIAEELSGFSECLAELTEEMEKQPFRDLLGPIYMEIGSKSSKNGNGEFYTPQEVAKLMVKMTIGKDSVPLDRPMTLQEPACGSGGIVLMVAEHLVDLGYTPLNMQVTCIDVSRLACDMCFINLTLWGIPATVVHGNALSLETWGQWQTIFWPLAKGRLPVHPVIEALQQPLFTYEQTDDGMCREHRRAYIC